MSKRKSKSKAPMPGAVSRTAHYQSQGLYKRGPSGQRWRTRRRRGRQNWKNQTNSGQPSMPSSRRTNKKAPSVPAIVEIESEEDKSSEATSPSPLLLPPPLYLSELLEVRPLSLMSPSGTLALGFERLPTSTQEIVQQYVDTGACSEYDLCDATSPKSCGSDNNGPALAVAANQPEKGWCLIM